MLSTQIANEGSMRVATKLGFTEVERFEDYSAEQWLGMWSSSTSSNRTHARADLLDAGVSDEGVARLEWFFIN